MTCNNCRYLKNDCVMSQCLLLGRHLVRVRPIGTVEAHKDCQHGPYEPRKEQDEDKAP